MSLQQDEAEKPMQKLLKAYRAVFGVQGDRSEAQKMVIEDMSRRGRLRSPIFVPDQKGELCPLRAAIADGRRGFADETIQMADYQSLSDKPKPTSKK